MPTAPAAPAGSRPPQLRSTHAGQTVKGTNNRNMHPVAPNQPPAAPSDPGADFLRGMAASPQGQWYAGLDENYQRYMDTLSGSINTQRAQLDAGLASALGSLGQRRDAAAAAYTALPGQLQGNDAYGVGQRDKYTDQGLAGVSSDTMAAKGGKINAGRTDADAQRTADNTFEQGLQPMLAAANTANYTVGQDRLNAEHLQGVNALEQQRTAGELQMQQEKDQNANQMTMALMQRQWQVADQNQQHQWQVQQTNQQYGLNPSSDKMLGDQGFTNADIEKARKDPAYSWYQDQIKTGKMSPEELYYNLRNSGSPALEAVVVRDHPEYFNVDPQTGAVGVPVTSGTGGGSYVDPNKWGFTAPYTKQGRTNIGRGAQRVASWFNPFG